MKKPRAFFSLKIFEKSDLSCLEVLDPKIARGNFKSQI